MYKKDNSSIDKHHLKHIGQFHKEKLKNKFKDKIAQLGSMNGKAFGFRCFLLPLLNDGLDLLSAIAHKTQAKCLLDSSNRL